MQLLLMSHDSSCHVTPDNVIHCQYYLFFFNKCFYIHVSKYPPNAIFCNANMNVQRVNVNVTGSMNWYNTQPRPPM